MKDLILKTIFLSLFLTTLLFSSDSFYYAFGKKVEVKKLPQSRNLDDANITYYQTQNGHKIGVKHSIIIGCEKNTPCLEALKKYDIVAIEKLSPTLYLLTLPKDADPFEVSNSIYHEKGIKLAHPNFIQKRQLR